MNVIAEKRKLMGLSQKKLAGMVNVDRTAVSKWEIGESKPRADILIKLAKIFGCSIDELLSEEKA